MESTATSSNTRQHTHNIGGTKMSNITIYRFNMSNKPLCTHANPYDEIERLLKEGRQIRLSHEDGWVDADELDEFGTVIGLDSQY